MEPFIDELKKNPSGKTKVALNDWNGKELKGFSIEAKNEDLIKLANKYFYLKGISEKFKKVKEYLK